MTMTKTTVFRTFTMDFTAEVHYARNAAGVVYRRTRGRGWGGRYCNSAWSRTGLDSIPAEATDTGRACRIPAGEAVRA